MGSLSAPRVGRRRERISVGSHEPRRLDLALRPLEGGGAKGVEDEFPLSPEPGPRSHEDTKDCAAGEFKPVLRVQSL